MIVVLLVIADFRWHVERNADDPPTVFEQLTNDLLADAR